MRGRALVIVALAGALGAAAALPARAQGLFDDNEARRRIDVLRQQVELGNRRAEERLAKIETQLSSAADRSAILDIAGQLEAIRSEMARMRGQMEVLANQAETADKRQRDLYLDIDTRLRKLEQAREQAEQKPAASAANPEAGAPEGEQKAYQAALDQFKLGNYALAVSAMQGFLVTYPNSVLASNAQYWMGMSYSGQRDYKNAIAAQRKLLTAWPDSAKAPDALLSISSAQETMGDRRASQATLTELISRFPQSSAAASAKQRLAALPRR